ncbi:Protein of unknown function [Aneurinibacillus thermoaerophilus]|uniref:DUF1064 domain-containing protein n=1 Tax=Aneurinibacillus thermoaerophilus TaxID=143495 RepID=A0A1G7WR81_ANETH|nr:DUF1064 domain-containing protein [Aneurinibacillus thermoaerophilus]SDG73740.1 Protein of unknown function [Aneurinibacillus thermoaerophilus]
MAKNKYNARKVVVDGITFDSKIEAQYYLYLKELKEKGEVLEFQLQPQYLLQGEYINSEGKKIRPIYYIADFLVTYKDGTQEVIDIKGKPTPEAKLKKKLFEYKYKIPLLWIVYVAKRGGWLLYEENERLKREEKKAKKQED